MRTYHGTITTHFFWLIPILIGFSKSNVDNKANVYAIHITPWIEIGFNSHWQAIKRDRELKKSIIEHNTGKKNYFEGK